MFYLIHKYSALFCYIDTCFPLSLYDSRVYSEENLKNILDSTFQREINLPGLC